ncbi:MAG: efflux RND transporter permease subunit [Deltaproteobacteria bacterium]|nr:efflux RND transporter permease subunit [Deltaproteobacteria bacterium]
MFLSDLAVRRPVVAIVANLLLVIFGVISFTTLPLREYPDINPPIVSIETQYIGASADIVETRITQLLEDRIAGIEGIKSIESVSQTGVSQITIEFKVGRDIDAAANDIRDRIGRAIENLPDEADPPEVQKVDANEDVMMWMNLSSSRLSQLDLTDYAERYLADRFSVVDGVARVRVGGGRRYSMRVWLDRVAMAAREITVNDIEQRLREENVELPAGRIESVDREFVVRIQRPYKDAQDFANLVIRRGTDGYQVRLGEVAKVELGPEDDRSILLGNGEEMVGLGIVRQSTANILEVAEGIKAKLEEVKKSLPEDVTLTLSYDTSVFVEAAIVEVYKTLIIAMILVVLVIYLFLGNIRATLIPAVTVPVSLTASLIMLNYLNFSINLFTLLALLLAIGMVVDDSIVVLENIHRRLELGEPPMLAAFRGTRQVGFAVIATTAVLISVFVPIAFLEGNIGRLFVEFALAMAAAVGFSSFVALTLSPVMAAKLLKKSSESNRLNQRIDRDFMRLQGWYKNLLDKVLNRTKLAVFVMVVMVALIVVLFRAVPSELAPDEDRGAFFVIAKAQEGASYDYTLNQMLKVQDDLMPLIESGEATRVLTRVPLGFSSTGTVSGGIAIVVMDVWENRERSTQAVMGELMGKLMAHPGLRAFPMMRQGIGARGLSQPIQFVIGGPSYEELAGWRDIILERVAENPNIVAMDTDYKETKPYLFVDVDTTRAADLGVPLVSIGRTLETMLGSRRVTTYPDRGEEYDVILQGRDEDRMSPSDIRNLYVRSERSGELIPLDSLVTLSERADSESLNRFNRFRSITFSANLAPGYTLGEALEYLQKIAREELPPSAVIDYKGVSAEFRESSSQLYFVFALALIVVYLVLAAQFESFVHPAIIMFTVPPAIFGALAGLFLFGNTLNIYSQIGIVMLVGLAAKNGILIVEFANQLRDQGFEFRDALLRGSEARLRPILMTGISTAVGAIPLILTSGAGAASRLTIGVVVFAGVIFTTMLTLFVVPIFYNMFAKNTSSPHVNAQKLEKLDAEVPQHE